MAGQGKAHNIKSSKSIRRLTAEDIFSVYTLGKEQFFGEGWYTKKFLLESLKGGISLGAYQDGRLIGCILVKVYDPPKSWIYLFIVSKRWRGKGMGRKLLLEAERKIPEENYYLVVDLEKKDKEGLRFYKRNGFMQRAKVKGWFGDKTEGLLLVKDLR